MFKFNNDVFTAIFQAFAFGLEVYIYFKPKVTEEQSPFLTYFNALKKTILKFLEAFLHKTGKRISVVIRNTYGLREHLGRNMLKMHHSTRNESKILKKNLLLMIIDLFFFERFVRMLLTLDEHLLSIFREDLGQLFASVLEIIKNEKLKIPREMFFVIQYFFKIYIILIADEWEKFVLTFHQFVELMIYFQNKKDFNSKKDLFTVIQKSIELYDIPIHGDSEKLVERRNEVNNHYIHFMNRDFQSFFEQNFLIKKSKIIYSILKESFKLMERMIYKSVSSLEKYANSFFILLEHYILKYLDNSVMVKLNQLMNFLKFLCDQLLENKAPIMNNNLILSKKNNDIVSSIFTKICEESVAKKQKRKASEALNIKKEQSAFIRNRNLTEIKQIHPMLHEKSVDFSSNNDSESAFQGRYINYIT
jgi:hypothetical protein